ncbi:MAG: hypothetical protein ACRD8Z_26745 [Nitrososphaeraceae archaeon]
MLEYLPSLAKKFSDTMTDIVTIAASNINGIAMIVKLTLSLCLMLSGVPTMDYTGWAE